MESYMVIHIQQSYQMLPKIKTYFSEDIKKSQHIKQSNAKKTKRPSYWSQSKNSFTTELDKKKSMGKLKTQTDNALDSREDDSIKNPQTYKTKTYIQQKIAKIQRQKTPNKIQLSVGCTNAKCKICKKYNMPMYDRNNACKHQPNQTIIVYPQSRIVKRVLDRIDKKKKVNERKVVSVYEVRDDEDEVYEEQAPRYEDIIIRKIIRQNYDNRYKTEPAQEIEKKPKIISIDGKLYEILQQEKLNKSSQLSYLSKCRQQIQVEKQQKMRIRAEEKQKIRQYLDKQVCEYIKYDTIFYMRKTEKKYMKGQPKIQRFTLKSRGLNLSPSPPERLELDYQKTDTHEKNNLEHMNIDIELKQYKYNEKMYQTQEKTQFYSIKFPALQNVDEMIKKYESLTGELNIEKLKKMQVFYKEYCTQPGKQFLYFGGWDYQNNERNGQGVYLNKNVILEGLWVKGNIVKGAELRSQSIYKGQFKNFKKHGHGQCKWLNGEEYVGEWRNGSRHGHGFWSAKNGDETYSGEWSNGKVNGYGQYYKKNQSIYKGSFENFIKKGAGIELFPNGDRFEGQYSNGQPNGKGKYIWQCGLQFEGEFKNGLRFGKGYLMKQQMFELQGQFANQKPNGICRLKLSNGDVYRGKFILGQKYGPGAIQYGDVTFHEFGFWSSQVSKQKLNPQFHRYNND